MIDVIGWVLQSAFIIAFFVWGYRMGKNSKIPDKKDQSVCSCLHAYSMHEDDGKCAVYNIKRLNQRDVEARCACFRYDGVPPAHIYIKDI